MLSAADLVRLGELVKLAAETARVIGASAGNGKFVHVTDIANRMEAAADELIQAGQTMEAQGSRASRSIK